MMEKPQFDVLQQLKRRNAIQVTFFNDVVISHKRLLLNLGELRKKSSELTSDKAQLQQSLAELQKQIESNAAAVASGGSRPDLEAKILKLQEELTGSYKTKSENAQNVVDANASLRETQELLKKRDVELEHEKSAAIDLRKERNNLKKSLEEAQDTIRVMGEELEALKLVNEKTEERARQLEAENGQLVQRWMNKMMEEAEKMNEANEFYNTMLEDSKKQELLKNAEQDPVDLMLTDIEDGLVEIMACKVPSKAKRNFVAHKGEVNAVAFNSSGSTLATGSNDKMIKLWDARSGNLKATLPGSMGSVMCVKFSSNGKFVLGASTDNAARIWDLDQCRVRHTLTGHIGKVFTAVFSSDSQKVITGSHDRTIKVWDLAKGYCIRTIFCFSSCNDICMTMDGSMACSGHLDGHVRFWDTKNGDCAQELTSLHSKQITSVSLHPDGRTLLTSSRDNTLKMVDIRTFEQVQSYAHPDYRLGVNWAKASFSADGRYVASGGADGTMFIWDTFKGSLNTTLRNTHTTTVTSSAWNPNGHQMASVDRGGSLVLWE
eukprot:TRINITY_DN2938_c0_g1_i1.p1 TRINITY_DN2938_c0_g1~~TRINITY_DN2938_c0_g1_i1.p1  ORF type:complete len:547 (+),score=107.35 TRINITY_DN2938_c0_g1_i1:163-1803(+)